MNNTQKNKSVLFGDCCCNGVAHKIGYRKTFRCRSTRILLLFRKLKDPFGSCRFLAQTMQWFFSLIRLLAYRDIFDLEVQAIVATSSGLLYVKLYLQCLLHPTTCAPIISLRHRTIRALISFKIFRPKQLSSFFFFLFLFSCTHCHNI